MQELWRVDLRAMRKGPVRGSTVDPCPHQAPGSMGLTVGGSPAVHLQVPQAPTDQSPTPPRVAGSIDGGIAREANMGTADNGIDTTDNILVGLCCATT